MRQRDEAIDILKGIGIILVLVAHSLGGFVAQFSYSFHMPLFFIVAGLFIAEYKNTEELSYAKWWLGRIKKDFKRLLIPAFLTITLILLLSCLYYVIDDTCLKDPVTIVWKDNPEKLLGNLIIPGNMWFLFALFFSKQFFYLLRYCVVNLGHLAFVTLVIGGLSVVIGLKVQLPFCVLIGASVLPLIWGGVFPKTIWRR